jgi:hypothetical protein
MVVSAWRRVSRIQRQSNSALMVFKNVSTAALSWQLPLQLFGDCNPCQFSHGGDLRPRVGEGSGAWVHQVIVIFKKMLRDCPFPTIVKPQAAVLDQLGFREPQAKKWRIQ